MTENIDLKDCKETCKETCKEVCKKTLNDCDHSTDDCDCPFYFEDESDNLSTNGCCDHSREDCDCLFYLEEESENECECDNCKKQ